MYIKDVRNKWKVTFNIRVPQFVTTTLKSGYKFPARSPNLFTLSRGFVFRGLLFETQWRRAATQLNAPDNVHTYISLSSLSTYPPVSLHICPSKSSVWFQNSDTGFNTVQYSSAARRDCFET